MREQRIEKVLVDVVADEIEPFFPIIVGLANVAIEILFG